MKVCPILVGYLAVDGGEVHLKVAAEHHGARRTGDGQGYGSGNGVVYVQKTHGEAAQLNYVPGLNHIELHAGDAVFLQLQVYQRQGQLGAVQRHGYLAQHIGCCADMVLMPVGQQHAANPFPVFNQVGYVGDDQIYPQHIFLGENGPTVHNQHVVAVFHNGDVFAKLVYASQGDDAQLLRGFGHWSLLLRANCSSVKWDIKEDERVRTRGHALYLMGLKRKSLETMRFTKTAITQLARF